MHRYHQLKRRTKLWNTNHHYSSVAIIYWPRLLVFCKHCCSLFMHSLSSLNTTSHRKHSYIIIIKDHRHEPWVVFAPIMDHSCLGCQLAYLYNHGPCLSHIHDSVIKSMINIHFNIQSPWLTSTSTSILSINNKLLFNISNHRHHACTKLTSRKASTGGSLPHTVYQRVT